MLLSRLLNFCLYFNLDAWGTAQSEDVIFGEFPASDALEEEFELQYNFKTKQSKKNKPTNQILKENQKRKRDKEITLNHLVWKRSIGTEDT